MKKLEKFTVLLFLIFFIQNIFSQNTEREKEIYKKLGQASAYNKTENRDLALKLLNEAYDESKKINYKSGILNASEGLMSVYINKNDFKKVIEIANAAQKVATGPKDIERLAHIHMNKGMAYSNLGFLDQGIKEFNRSIFYNSKSTDKNLKSYEMSLTYQNMASHYERKGEPDSIVYYLKKGLEEIKKIDDSSRYFGSSKYSNIIFANMNIANFYTGISKPQKLDMAEKYFNENLKYKNTDAFKSNSVFIFNTFGRFYLEKKDYLQAIDFAEKALKNEQNSNNPEERKISYNTLNNAYEKLGNKEMQIKYLKLYTNISDSLSLVDKSSVNYSTKQIVAENEQEFDKNSKKILAIILFIFAIKLFILGLLWLRHSKKTKLKYETIINDFKENINAPTLSVEEQIEIQEDLTNCEKNKSNEITEGTIKSILTYLDQFEKTNEFTKNDVNRSYLANYANTNTKYLNEILKKYKGKSFSKYINSLRVNYIMKLLYLEPKYREYKVSYLAEISGFSSREVFSTVFKKETGLSTSYYINQLKNEPETGGKNYD